MTNKQHEQISALLDNALSPDECTEALKSIHSSEDLRNTWNRYHLIGDAIRGENITLPANLIADHVRERLESEPAIIASPKHADQRSGSFKYHDNVHWLRPAAGMAMAASVAALAILLFPKYSDIASDGPGVQVASAPSTVIYTTSTGTRWKKV